MDRNLQGDKKSIEKEKKINKDIVVSVWIPTYFAGEYVREAIESILMQETEYTYEIVINDDCSGDDTWKIISEYASKYPSVISAVRNEKNLGLSANVLATKLRCRGQYIVNLSGDDYWINKHKIQKQVDFLKNRPEYVGVGSKVEIRYDDLKVASSYYPAEVELGKDFTKESYNRGVNLPSHGFMIRNIFVNSQKRDLINRVYAVSATVDDLYDPILYLQFGKIYIMEEATCAHRIPTSKNGKHNFNSLRKPLEKALMILEGYKNLEKLQVEGIDLTKRFCSVFNLIILNGIRSGDFKSIGIAYKLVPLRYRKPWYKSVAFKCSFSVWRAGFNYLKERIRKKTVLNNMKRGITR